MKQKTFLKKVLSVVLALAMIIPGVYLGEAISEGKMEEVQAATTDGTYVTEAYDDLKAKGYDAYNNVPQKDGYLFAGWYSDAECTKANRIRSKEKVGSGDFAKFVLKDVLSVKAQSTTGAVTSTNIGKYQDKYIIRFVSSVDSLNYKQVGFKLTYPDGTSKSVTTSTVFSRIASTTGSVGAEKDTYQYSPQVLCVDSRYFITAKLTLTDAELDDDYTIQAFWVTADGVRVYGDSRVISYNDKADNIINMHVDTALDTNKTYTAKSGDTELGSVEVLDKNNVRITLTTGRKASVPSLSDITFTPSDGSEAVVQKAYRNIGSVYTGTPDKTWYTYDTTKKEYVVVTSADLYGVAALISASSNFASDVKIYLASDITVNTGDASTWGTTAPTYTWTPIGNSSQSFAATFDGNGHTIRGVYRVNQGWREGFFGVTTSSAVIKNFKLINSYFEAPGSCTTSVGSIVGRANGGTFDTIYSNAIVVSAVTETGGLIGYTNGTVNMNNCWFDGTVTNTTTDKAKTGGLIGAANAQLTLTNCLNTGTVDASAYITESGNYSYVSPYVGGLVGHTTNKATTVTIQYCLNIGEVKYSDTANFAVGPIVGVDDGPSTSCTDTYATKESCQLSLKAWMETDELVKVDESAIKGNKDIIKTETLSGLFTESEKWSLGIDDNSFPYLKSFADGQSGEKGWYDVSWYTDNTNASVFYLHDKEDLYGFAKIVRGEAVNANGAAITAYGFSGKTVYLENDIVINTGDASTWATNAPLYSWTPIGNNSNQFAGTFDGNGHTISGIYRVNQDWREGFFGVTASSAVIKNFKLVNSYFEAPAACGTSVGSIVGRANGGTFDAIYSNAIVVSAVTETGGLIGYTSGTVNMNNCWFDGTVTNTTTDKAKTGGLIGAANAQLTLTNCLNTGTVDASAYITESGNYSYVSPYVGGLVGHTTSSASTVTIQYCLNTGEVKYSDTANFAVGPIVGVDDGLSTSCTDTYATKESCQLSLRAWMETDELVKVDESAIKGNSDTIKTEILSGLFEEANAGYWSLGINDYSFPYLTAFESEAVDLTIDTSWYDADPNATEFVLMDAADLNGFAYISMTDNFQGQTVKLGADITVNTGNAAEWATNAPKYEWYPIGKPNDGSFKPFRGTFDGQNHYISGLYMKRSDQWNGLFAYASETTIKNFTLKNSYFYSSDRGLGGICGQLYSGTISDVGIDKNVYIVSNLAGSLSDVGGFAGRTCAGDYTAYITNCWFGGTVKNLSTTSRNTGGFVGMAAEGTLIMTDCFMTGHVDVKAFQGYARAGGFVGWNYYNKTEMLRCVYNGTYEVMSGVNFCAFIALDSQTVTNTGTEEAPIYTDNSKVTFIDCYYAGTSKYYSVEHSGKDTNGNLPYTHKGNEPGDMGWVGTVWTNADATMLGSGWTVVDNYYPYLNAFPQSAETKAVSVDSTEVKTWNSELLSQGGWTDGKYFYQAWINKNTENEALNTVKIIKYDVATGEIAKESGDLSLCHANDIAFDATNNRFVVAHASVENFKVSFVDTENLTVTGTKTLDTTTLGITGIYSIDYNVDKECYVVGVSGGQRFMILDANFNQLKQVDPYRPTYMLREYTTQGITCDRDYIYHALSDPTNNANKIAQYDWNGNFIRVIELGIEGEIENISVVGNQIYFAAANQAEDGTSYVVSLYKFDLPAL